MGSLSKAAIAACIVLSGMGPQATDAGSSDALSVQMTDSYDVVVRTRMKHPSSRKTVSGPWPRFAKKMLA
jgi:hypothetical protein